MTEAVPVVHCIGVVKDYRGLRPLRLLDLRVMAGDRVVLGGIDVIGAEVVTNLINGATLPDQGEVRVFGQATHEITDLFTTLDTNASSVAAKGGLRVLSSKYRPDDTVEELIRTARSR